MQFVELKNIIKHLLLQYDFQESTEQIQKIIFDLDKNNFLPLISEIGSIPEDIEHDSTEEKLYAKVSDIILAKCFIELGLKAEVLKERANCADVIAKSQYHNYSLVADAKAFRLSRSAKNQKDFKVESMVHWRHDNNYSVLCCPYFQYPKTKSQIYGQALKGNVLLFSWEYFSLLLNENILETETFNLSELWDFSSIMAQSSTVQNMELCFLPKQNDYIKSILNYSNAKFENVFKTFKQNIITRGEEEIEYWNGVISSIHNYSREEAIDLLLEALKLNKKVSSIKSYINQLQGELTVNVH